MAIDVSSLRVAIEHNIHASGPPEAHEHRGVRGHHTSWNRSHGECYIPLHKRVMVRHFCFQAEDGIRDHA